VNFFFNLNIRSTYITDGKCLKQHIYLLEQNIKSEINKLERQGKRN